MTQQIDGKVVVGNGTKKKTYEMLGHLVSVFLHTRKVGMLFVFYCTIQQKGSLDIIKKTLDDQTYTMLKPILRITIQKKYLPKHYI